MNKRGRYFGNPYFAIHKNDKYFLGYFLSLGLFSLLYTIFVVLPYQSSSSDGDFESMNISSTNQLNSWTPMYYFRYSLVIFLHLNIFINFCKIITNSSHLNSGILNEKGLKEGHQEDEENVCLICDVVKPMRCHHCIKCNVCVKKRIHHCVLNGTCIGYDNQRYYISMIIYIFITSTIFNSYHVPMTLNFMKHVEPLLTPLYLLVPHFLLLVGYISLTEFLLCLLTIKGLAIQCFSCIILIKQLIMVINGQTSYEGKTNRKDFDKGYVDNLREVFGAKWYVAWVCPLIKSALPGDGMKWQEYSKII